MNAIRRRSLSSALLLACTALVSAGARDVAWGVYARDSRTCGGPGSADGPMTCTLVTRDEMQIASPASAPSDGHQNVSFFVHYGYGEYCRFEGQGSWSKERLRLSSAASSNVKACQLALVPERGRITIRDPGGKCVSALCTTTSGRLNGVVFRSRK